MSKHTPGPWTVDDEGNVCLGSSGNMMIAWVASPDDIEVYGESPESLANAHLIAAAPDLFEVLKEIIANWSARRGIDLDNAQAAIAKAEGKSS